LNTPYRGADQPHRREISLLISMEKCGITNRHQAVWAELSLTVESSALRAADLKCSALMIE
jgi:hypothetical protein